MQAGGSYWYVYPFSALWVGKGRMETQEEPGPAETIAPWK